jgi:hypothetical protein
MSLVDHPTSQPSFDSSPIWTPIIAAEDKTTTPFSADYVRKLCVYIGATQRICLFSDGL